MGEQLKQRQELEFRALCEKNEAKKKAEDVKLHERVVEIKRHSGEKRKALEMGHEEGEVADDNDDELFDGPEKAEEEFESAKKKENLKRIMDEMSELNKTKSKMVWLLKQVITAEKKAESKVEAGTDK